MTERRQPGETLDAYLTRLDLGMAADATARAAAAPVVTPFTLALGEMVENRKRGKLWLVSPAAAAIRRYW